jgi:hypothetical protein
MTPRIIAAPSALFLLSGATKLAGHRRSLEMRDHIGVRATSAPVIPRQELFPQSRRWRSASRRSSPA